MWWQLTAIFEGGDWNLEMSGGPGYTFLQDLEASSLDSVPLQMFWGPGDLFLQNLGAFSPDAVPWRSGSGQRVRCCWAFVGSGN